MVLSKVGKMEHNCVLLDEEETSKAEIGDVFQCDECGYNWIVRWIHDGDTKVLYRATIFEEVQYKLHGDKD